MCIFIQNIKFLSLILWLGGLYKDADNNNTKDADDDNNCTRRTHHDYIGSFGFKPN